MKQNGALWMKRLRLCRDVLDTGLRDWLALGEPLKKQRNAAAYLTTAFENEKKCWGT